MHGRPESKEVVPVIPAVLGAVPPVEEDLVVEVVLGT